MKRLFLVLIIVLFFSCGEKVIEKPDNLLSKEMMADILYDLALIQAAKTINPAALEERHIKPMHYLYRKYNFDSVQFVESDIYYASLPSEYGIIYKSVESRLGKGIEVMEKEGSSERDSLKNKPKTEEIIGKQPKARKISPDTLP